MAADLTLANYRRPLENVKKLSATEKKQLGALLKQEGTTITKAAKDEEMSMELVDVVDGKGKAKYQLYLWPFGSGALLAAGTTKVVASIAQHGFDMAKEDAELRKAIAAAWKASAKKLKIQETVEFSPPKAPKADPKAELDAQKVKLFPRTKEWRTYPKLAPSDLSDEQRAFIDAALAAQRHLDLEFHGLFRRDEDMLRFIGKGPQGPSDVEISVGKDKLPLWCSVSRVASGHMKHDAVLAAFKKLPAAQALAAWTEIASGHAYDVHEARPTSMKESDIPRTKLKQAHSTRLFNWMADASLALGPQGHAAAVKLLDELPDFYFSEQMYIAALSLLRHEQANGTEFPARFDAVLADRFGPKAGSATAFAETIKAEIVKARGLS